MDPIRSLIKVNDFLRKEMEVSAIQAKIQNQAREEMDRTQREYFLREQLRAIKKELGDLDETTKEMEEYRLKIAQARMPKQAEEDALNSCPGLSRCILTLPRPIVRTYLTGWYPCPGARERDKSKSKRPRLS
jgi:ATP-dependent Lon protease